jgi:hypothetical protein
MPDADSVERIRRWTRAILDIDDTVTISISEMNCTDPACPGLETVILVLREGEETRAYRSPGSALTQTRPLIEKAVRGEPQTG